MEFIYLLAFFIILRNLKRKRGPYKKHAFAGENISRKTAPYQKKTKKNNDFQASL